MNYWLMKSEPSVFGIDDLAARPKKTEPWDGVRNYQARNMMRDTMRRGDLAFFYHSNCEPPGIVGIMEVVREGYPDPTQFDPESKYHDPKSDLDDPRWYLVDVRLKKRFRAMVTLAELREHAGELGEFALLRKGNRLSVMPVETATWQRILELAGS
ncbi:MAG: EVE domain-containing protein [Gammaproteobacteria bacterium]|jgi:predicted RNA-binding protein with PUA-like domain|nr:EVE domain-containing protein [Gammaproteobacteria bacterium]